MQSEICYMPYTIERFSRSTTAAEEDELNKKFSYRWQTARCLHNGFTFLYNAACR